MIGNGLPDFLDGLLTPEDLAEQKRMAMIAALRGDVAPAAPVAPAMDPAAGVGGSGPPPPAFDALFDPGFEADALHRQMALAREGAQPRQLQFGPGAGLGPALGSIGNLIGTLGGEIKQRKLQGQERELLRRTAENRKAAPMSGVDAATLAASPDPVIRAQGEALLKREHWRAGLAAEGQKNEREKAEEEARFQRDTAIRREEAKLNRQAQIEAAGLAAGRSEAQRAADRAATASRDLEEEVRQWSGKIPAGTKQSLDAVFKAEDIAAELGGIDKIAGVGLVEGILPKQALDSKANEFRRQTQAALIGFRKSQAGASLTPQEKTELDKAIESVGAGASVQDVALSLKLLHQLSTSSIDQALAGAPESVRGRIMPTFQRAHPASTTPMQKPPTAPPPGMKWQRNKKTGELRLVPLGGA